MSVGLSAGIAVVFLFCWRHFSKINGSSDVFFGMCSALFWLVCAGASWINSSGDVTNIYFYYFWASIGMLVATLIVTLSWKPTQETNQEKREAQTLPDKRAERREKLGLRPLNR